MKKLFRFFLQGLLYIAPIGITIYILYVIVIFVDGLLQEWLEALLNFSIPGLGLVVTIVLLIVIGFLGQTFIARPFKSLFNKLMKRKRSRFTFLIHTTGQANYFWFHESKSGPLMYHLPKL